MAQMTVNTAMSVNPAFQIQADSSSTQASTSSTVGERITVAARCDSARYHSQLLAKYYCESWCSAGLAFLCRQKWNQGLETIVEPLITEMGRRRM